MVLFSRPGSGLMASYGESLQLDKAATDHPPFCQAGRGLPAVHNNLLSHFRLIAPTYTLPHTLFHHYFPLDSILTQTWVLYELWVGSLVVNCAQ